ncbi:MAG: hypothetical protein OWT27_00365, partial [Firmicutes bacterium]|nr:hypothetical protein [Bacillota bacterium]
ERFVSRYPLYVHLPYRWDGRRLVVEPGTMLWGWDERRSAAPLELRDFSRLLCDEIGQPNDVWATVLLHNAALFERTRQQLRTSVFHDADAVAAVSVGATPDVAALLERLCRHPESNSVLVRQAFVRELVERRWVGDVISHVLEKPRTGSITSAIAQGLRVARSEIATRQRVQQLASALAATRGAPDPAGIVTCEQLAALCQTDLAAATELVHTTLVPMEARLPGGAAQADGCFLADADGTRTLVALDPCTHPELPESLVHRTCALRAAYGADTALILALTPLTSATVELADRLRVLILPRVEFAAMLSRQAPGVARLIERSHAQARAHVES